MARTTQLAVIVTRTAYSKTGSSIMCLACIRIGLSAARIKRDVGPESSGDPLFRGMIQLFVDYDFTIKMFSISSQQYPNKYLFSNLSTNSSRISTMRDLSGHQTSLLTLEDNSLVLRHSLFCCVGSNDDLVKIISIKLLNSMMVKTILEKTKIIV